MWKGWMMKIWKMTRMKNCNVENELSYLQDLFQTTKMYFTINIENYFEVFHTMGIIVTINCLKNYLWPATIQPAGSTVSQFFMKNDFFVSESIRGKKKNENEKKIKKITKTKKSLKNSNVKKSIKSSKTKKSLKKKKEEKKFKNEKYLKCQKLLSSTENFLRTRCRKRRSRRRRGRSRRKGRIELLLLLAEVRATFTEDGKCRWYLHWEIGRYCTGLYSTVLYCTVLQCTVRMSGNAGSTQYINGRLGHSRQKSTHTQAVPRIQTE